MGMILYIGDSKEIADNINVLQSCNHKIAVLNLKYNYKHYIEEYMPDYILLSEDTERFEEISDFVANNTDSRLIITGNKRHNSRDFYSATRISSTETWERFKKIIDTIDLVEPAGHEADKEYKFLKQQVISFYSVQGGTGKTSLLFNLAWWLRDREMGKILVIDLNFCEGPSDLSIKLGIDSRNNLGRFIEDILEGESEIDKSICCFEGIDLLLPPQSLYNSDSFDINMLNALIYSARSEYDIILADLPHRYDSISLEMINQSTASVLVMSPELRIVSRIEAFKKFIPISQNKMAILNKSEDENVTMTEEFEEITGLDLCSVIPFIPEKDKSLLKSKGRPTGIIGLQHEMNGIAKKIF